MKCDIKNYSDQTKCETCGLTWDINDAHPPKCPNLYTYNIMFYNKAIDKRRLQNARFEDIEKFVADLLVNGWKVINIKRVDKNGN